MICGTDADSSTVWAQCGAPFQAITTSATTRQRPLPPTPWSTRTGGSVGSTSSGQTVGPLELNGWTFIALNAELFGSGLDSEATQWTWLEERVNATPADRPTAIVSHKPLVTSDTELAAAPPYRFVPAAPAQRLRDLLGDRAIRLVISGHVHQYRVLQFDGTTHVWAPSTWAVLPEAIQPTFGAKRCGMLSLTLHDDGRFEQRLVEPVGLAQQTVGEDIPNPYGH